MAVTISSADLNPIQFASAWHNFYVSSFPNPGVIVVDGIEGFKRGPEWDKKKGKGATSETLTKVQYPLAEGSITCVLWLPEHFAQWGIFRPLLKFSPLTSKAAPTANDAYDIYYPSLADLGISACVTKDITPITHKGMGRYEVTIAMIEWRPVPAKPVVVTPSGATANGKSPKPPGDTGDPIADAQQKEIDALMKKAASTPTG